MIAGERASRAVSTVQARSKPDDEESVTRLPERRNRPAVIIRMRFADVVEETCETRTAPAARIELGARCDSPALHRALNCASSVEPRIAVIEELPPVTVCVTSSK